MSRLVSNWDPRALEPLKRNASSTRVLALEGNGMETSLRSIPQNVQGEKSLVDGDGANHSSSQSSQPLGQSSQRLDSEADLEN